MTRQEVGRYGEDLAARFLFNKGFKIVERNFRTRWGEIDIIAERDGAIHFVEVKTRTGVQTGEPEEAINYFKMQRLKGVAQSFLHSRNLMEVPCQFDSVAIVLNIPAKKAKIRFLGSITV